MSNVCYKKILVFIANFSIHQQLARESVLLLFFFKLLEGLQAPNTEDGHVIVDF